MITQKSTEQQDLAPHKDFGKGKFRFILGRGTSGAFGHVELTLHLKSTFQGFTVQWQPETNNLEEARARVEKAVADYLGKYLVKRPHLGFIVTITEVASDNERRNDYERAAQTALRFALEDLGLPVPQIFGMENEAASAHPLPPNL